MFRRISEPRLIIISTFLAAYTAYILAEHFNASGVLSVVTAGLVLGWHQHETLKATSRTQAWAVWDVTTFLMEALVFILIGFSLRGVMGRMGGAWGAIEIAMPIAAAVTATVIIARLAWAFAGTYVPRVLWPPLAARDPAPPPSTPLVVGWAGMRGVVSLAIALALPQRLAGRDILIFSTFVVILVTILGQGGTLGALIRWLGLREDETAMEAKELSVRARMAQASLTALRTLRDPTGDYLHAELIDRYGAIATSASTSRAVSEEARRQRSQQSAAALRALQAGRLELLRQHRAGAIHDSSLHRLEAELDVEELRLLKISEGFA